MADAVEGEPVAASLREWLAELTFLDRPADEVTALLTDAVVAWGERQGWRVYRRAASVLPLPPPFQHRRSCVDVACARRDGPPVVVEIDRTDRRRTVEKLLAEAGAGRVAVWLRWGSGELAPAPAPVLTVACQVSHRRAGPGAEAGQAGWRYSRQPQRHRPAPAHTPGPLSSGPQPELFAPRPPGGPPDAS